MNINFNKKRRQPTREGHVEVPYAPGKRTLSNLKWRLTLLVVLSPFIYFGGKMIFSLFVAPSSGFVVLDIQHYQSAGEGIVREIFVEIGQKVEVGEMLMVLEDRELDAEISRQESNLLAMMEHSSKDNLSGAYLTKQRDLALSSVEYQRERLADISYLFSQGAATTAEKKSAVAQLEAAKMNLNSAQYALDQWKANEQQSTEDIKKSSAYRNLIAKLALLQEEREQLTILATYPGQVTEISATMGQIVLKGNPLIAIAHQDRQVIASFIHPSDIDRIDLDKPVDIVFPSGTVIQGKVQYNPSVAGRLPSYLATPMMGRPRMVVVHLVPLSPVPAQESIDGLPVDVKFNPPVQVFLNRMRSLVYSAN